MSDYFSRSGAAQRDDISPTPGSTAPEYAIGEPAPAAGAAGTPDTLAEEALRWSMAALLFQCTAILILIVAWIPGVEWFYSASQGCWRAAGAQRACLTAASSRLFTHPLNSLLPSSPQTASIKFCIFISTLSFSSSKKLN